jgi:hypothetical protein
VRILHVAAILAALTVPTLSADLTPASLRALLAEQEASAVMASLDAQSWTNLLAHIEAGERGWIDLVPLLAPGASTSQAKSLALTLSRALQANAPGVLSAMLDDFYTVDTVCGGSAVDVSTIDAALVKVAAVLDPALFEVRNQCLHELGQARISALT